MEIIIQQTDETQHNSFILIILYLFHKIQHIFVSFLIMNLWRKEFNLLNIPSNANTYNFQFNYNL